MPASPRFALLLASCALTLVACSEQAADSGSPPAANARAGQGGKPAEPALSIAGTSAAEGHSGTTPFAFTVTLSPAASQAVQVRYRTRQGTARDGEDFTGASGELAFLPGETQKIVTVAVRGDTAVEPDESFEVQLQAARNAQLGTDSAGGVIFDDDGPQPVMSIGDAQALEGDGAIKFPVSVTPTTSRTITVNWSTTDGSARSGSDYAGGSGTLTIPPGATSVELTLAVTNDSFDENDEVFTVGLSAASGATIGNGLAEGTIHDDDDSDLLQVGAASRSLTPTQAQIDGIEESRAFGAGTHLQKFNLGGFGIDVGQNLPDPAGDIPAMATSTEPAGRRVFRNAAGVDEHTALRLLAIEEPAGDVVVFVMIDAIGAGNLIQAGVKQAIVARAAELGVTVSPNNVLFGQTHSHTAADLQGLWGGVPQDWVRTVLYVAAAEAVGEALDTRRPARLTLRQGYTNDFNNYRRPRIDPNADADGTLTLLTATGDDGTPVGSVLQYNAHPTSVGDGNEPRTPHGEYIYGAVRWIEEHLGGKALYFNGPIADASPSGSRPGCVNAEVGSGDPSGAAFGAVRCRGEGIADFLLHEENARSARELAPTVAARSTQVVLPITNPAFLATAAAGVFNRYYNFSELPTNEIPGLTEEQAADLPQVAPVAVTTVSRVTLGGAGGLEIVTIPGETTNTMGDYVRSLASTNVMLLGLTHNSFGYILPEEEFSYVDQQGDNGLLVPFTGYEENVSLGPLTAPLLRTQGYNRLFDAAPQQDVPPTLLSCLDSALPTTCALTVLQERLNILIASVEACGEQGVGSDGCPLSGVLEFFDPVTDPIAEGCRDNGGPAELCAALGGDGGVGELGNPLLDTRLIASAADAQLRGCDLLDPSHCLLPFPSDHFTVAAPADSPQGVNRGGTGKRVNFGVAAMPRNAAGKPIDPTEWNRNDGFSPGQMIVTYVPGLGANADGTIPGMPTIRDARLSLDLARSPVLVLDAETGEPHPVWAEVDLNAGTLLYVPGREFGGPDQVVPSPKPKQAALIVRPATNFAEGRRYVVVLRDLKRGNSAPIAAGPAFAACRDHALEELAAMPTVQARCAALAENVFPVLQGTGIGRDASLYLAWDFTVASTANTIGRLRHMRDDAFRNHLGQQETAAGEITNLGRAPAFEVTEVNDYPASHGQLVREIKGTFTVPSYVVPSDPSPADGQAELRRRINQLPPEIQSQLESGPLFAPIEAALPPNRLNYLPDVSSAGVCDPGDPAAALQGRCVEQARFGDGLPDSVGEMSTTFTCRIAKQTLNNKSFAEAGEGDVAPARASLYGHGLLGDHGEINQDQLRNFGNDHNMMFCATDWFGFASGDLPNVLSFTVDLSNFPSLPDGTQQGILNQLFLARLLRHPQGFASHEAFRVGATPVFDTREVYYDGNSQGGITGGVVVAVSKDIRRGALGVLGMNYSTLLTRSVDFDLFSVPLYLSYPNDLDRSVNFSLMQMLWDRSENNGYAHHLRDNTALQGPAKAVLLHPAFGDHQVTMWSADAMARTVGATVDRSRVASARRAPVGFNNPELPGFATTDYANAVHAAGSGLMYWDESWPDTAWQDCAGFSTPPPPVGNVPPRTGNDPHECPRRQAAARCQKSHFLHSPGRLIDVSGVDGPAECPLLPAAEPLTPLPVAGDPGLAPFPFNPCAPDEIPGVGGECLLDVPGVGDALEAAWNFLNGGEPPAPPSGEDVIEIAEQAAENAQALPDDVVASAQQSADNVVAGTLADRSAEVVVMEGRSFPDWSQPAAQGVAMPYPNGALIGERDAHAGVMLYPPPGFTGVPTAAPAGEIVAYKRANSTWIEIPVQVDERFPYFLANPNSDFGIYSGTDTELTYAWDRETWKATGACFVDPTSVAPTPDPVAGLDDDDEIVFMARDSGDFANPAIAGPEGTVGGGQEVALVDPLQPDVPRYVYLFRKPGGATFSVYYVDYTRDANADQWIDRSFFEGEGPEADVYERNAVGTSNTGYGPNLSGTVCWDGTTPRNANDRFPRDGVTVSTDKYQLYASGRWMVRDLRVAKPGQPRVYGADIVDRWKGRAFQQSPDSTISLVGFEDEQVNWEANSALLGERVGPVRAIREIWGADSGTNVTKTETYYRDAYAFRYRVRVHPIPPDGLYTSWDYNRGAMVPADGEGVPGGRYYTAVRGTGVPIDGRNDDVGNFDGVGDTPAYFDASDPTLNLPLTMYNWEQVSAKGDLGSLVYLFELKSATIGANAAAIPYYRDDACLDDGTGDDPVQRPWPGESSTDERVRSAYSALAGGTKYEDLRCEQKQGAHAQHGVHFLAPPESDNAMLPVPADEIDGQQWSFPVPTAQPTNVGERYANVVRAPLVRTVRPRPNLTETSDGRIPGDYATCVAMASQGGEAEQEAAAKFSCAVIFGGGRTDGEAGENEIQGPNTYVPMDDGALIATNVYIPWACNVAKNPAATPCASVLEMSGYESGSDEGQTPAGDLDDTFGNPGFPLTSGTRGAHEKYYKSGERYVSITASVRGTGCSSGEFDVFSRKSAFDGHQLVEWMAAQPWSNGKVGIFGHSYSGITGAMIASTNPPHLAMVSISGQIGDIYRDIVYPGGVSNYGFPLLWTGAVRPAYDYLGGTFAGLISDSQDRQCLQNQVERSRTVENEPLIAGLSDTDGPWYRERSVINFLKDVKAPTHVTTAYQDEQTGPRGGTDVFDHLPANLTRRLVLLNGDHGSQTGPTEVTWERRFWMDRFLLDANDPNPNRRPRAWPASLDLPEPMFADDGTATSRVLLEVTSPTRLSNGHVDSSGFPLAQTQWTDYYFQVDGTLDTVKSSLAHGEPGSGSAWFNGSKRQFYSYQAGVTTGAEASTADAGGADELIFRLDVANDTVIAGPILADLYVTSSGGDTELMVQLIDADPATGERLYLQRGVLRASHREILAERSQCAAFPSGGRIADRPCTAADYIYRPFRPHTARESFVLGQVNRYALEVFPVGHVLRAGHQLMVKIHAPSLDDNDWAYIPKTPASVNTLHHSAQYPSSLRLPVIPLAAVSRLGAPTGTCADDNMRCVIEGETPFGAPVPVPTQDLADVVGAALTQIADGFASAFGSDADGATPGVARAGVGVVDMTPDVGYGAGQYTDKVFENEPDGTVDPYATARSQAKSYGTMSRLTARAIVVEGANGKRIALLKSDNYLAQDNLLRRVAQILGENRSTIGYDQILYGVTHAHSTSYYSTLSAGVWVFQDAYESRFFEFQARKLAEAILLAERNLKPARMGATTVRHKVFKGNVTKPQRAHDNTPAGYPREYGDHGLVVMRFDDVSDPANPKPLAAWINWGEHPEGLDGYDLHSADYVAFLERFVDRELGAPLVFSQGDVGSAEQSGNDQQRLRDDGSVCAGPGANGAACEDASATWRDWNHKGYVQNERNARFLADAAIKGWKVIGGELPADAPVAGIPPNNYVPAVQVAPSTTFPVDYRNAWAPGPLSHPIPGVSACRTEPTVEGDPGVPNAADCTRPADANDHAQQLWELAKAEGLPLPENYELPAFGTVEENLRLKLQAFRLGDVVLGSCACEAQVDLILNFESRANDVAGDIYDGFDWACVIDGYQDDPAYAQACTVQQRYYDPAEYPYDLAPHPEATNRDPVAIAHMRAQVHNAADGWDAADYVPYANAEPADVSLIKGNFTKEELPPERGYKLAVGVGHAGDYNGYTVSYREYMAYDHYRKDLTAYGAHTADYMVTRLVRMAGAMRGGVELAPEPQDAFAQADEDRKLAESAAHGAATAASYDAYYGALGPDAGQAAVLTEPAAIGYFEAATFSWRGGATAVDNPRVVVERRVDEQWQTFADQSGEVQTRVQWPTAEQLPLVYAGQFEWRWTASFEAFEAAPARLGSTPPGTYRFRVDGCLNDGANLGECRGNASAYTLMSPPFEVFDRASLVEGVQSDLFGNLAITVASRSIPRTYTSVFPYVRDDGGFRFCKECSFRPWAVSNAAAASVAVTVNGITTPALGSGTSWSAPAALALGGSATIVATYADGRTSRPFVYTR